MAERDLVVRFVGDDRQLNQIYTRQERRAQQFSGRMDKLGQTTRGFLSGFGSRTSLLFGSGTFIGSAAVSAGIAKSVSAASDLNEQVSKSRQIFGEASRSVEAWSETTAEAFGISQREALAATGTFGNLFRVIDLAPEKSAEMSRSLVQLAADLASFNNASPDEVLLAIRSGLIGEAEPLRRYGVLLSEARVQQIALATSGKDNVKALTDQEKALARYAIILEDTAAAQGDFARTSDSLANQQRKLKANFSDLAANLGKVFLPAVNEAVGAVNSVFSGFEALSNFVDEPIRIDTDINVSKLREFRAELVAAVGESDVRVRVLDATIQELERRLASVSDELAAQLSPALQKSRVTADGYATSLADAADRSQDLLVVSEHLGSSLADAGSRMQAAADAAENLAAAQARAAAVAEKRFSTSIKGLQLKLEKAELTPGLQDDLRVLNEILARIDRRIRAEGRTFELEQERVRVLAQIKSVQEQIASAEASAADAAASAARARTQEAKDEEARSRRAAAEAARRRTQRIAGDQFAALGLDREGQERVPGQRALRQRAATLQEQIKGTTLDTEKTRAQLARIRRVLSGEFGKVGKDVRQAILEMLREIANALRDGSKDVESSSGEITRGGIRSLKELTEGLGLTPEQIREMGRRQMGISNRDRTSAFGFGVPQTSTTGSLGFGGALGDIIINTTIELDGREVANSVNRVNQKNGRRRASARTGRAAGRTAGL